MRALGRESGQALILLGAWLFFGGGAASALLVYDRSPSELERAVRLAAIDEARQKELLAIFRQWESGQERLDKRVGSDREELLALLRQRGSGRADAGPILARLDPSLAEMDTAFLDMRFSAKNELTRAEWARIVARPDTK